MASSTALNKLEKLLSRLPFHLDDIKEANARYEIWKKTGKVEDRKIIDLWTYCFVWRGLLVKFGSHSKANSSDFDMVVAEVYERVVERRHTLRKQNKYASWVSVICRNIFINYIRKQKVSIPFDETIASGIVAEPDDVHSDTTVLIQVLEEAIRRLPAYLQDIAVLRILENRSYEEISLRTGKRIQIVRTYMNKAKRRLRNDDALLLFIKEEFREEAEN
ncbi:MAG: sigma-70 family RNA polymerase sigma factor [Rhodothermaceae bacterium]|nr:sigma-70 family RNA polymerase sigma factor [Rhodothermaceae bacterium]